MRIAAVGAAVLTMGIANASRLLVGDFGQNRVVVVNEFTGRIERVAASGAELNGPLGMTFGRDGYLYIANYRTNSIVRFNEAGQFVDTFVSTPFPHGLSRIGDDLVVSNHRAGTVSRIGSLSWVSLASARWYHAVVVRNGRLFASFNETAGGGIEEFDPNTGASLGDLLSPVLGLKDVQGFAWGSNGHLYVASSRTRRVHVFDNPAQLPFTSILSVNGEPLTVRFGASGDLISTGWGSNRVSLYSPGRRVHVRDVVGSAGGMAQPFYMDRLNPSIEGRVQLQSFAGSSLPFTNLVVEIRDKGQTASLSTSVVAIRPDGRFWVQTPAAQGEFDICIKAGAYLSQVRTVDTSDSSRSFPVFNLLGGDVDSSNVVDSVDYQLMVRASGSSVGDANYASSADLNGDGTVNPVDFTIFAANFGVVGQ